VVAIMSNGGFGGIHEKVLEALRSRWAWNFVLGTWCLSNCTKYKAQSTKYRAHTLTKSS